MQLIRYHHRHEIDERKWDNCVHNAVNRSVYAFSWYLDVVASNWGALIYKDYELVFPIIFKNFFFFKKIYQPLFCQQLGPFSKNQNLLKSKTIILEIILLLQKNNKKFQFSINHCCADIFKDIINTHELGINYLTRINLNLDLDLPYTSIYANYNNNTKRNLKSCSDFSMKKIDINDFLLFYRSNIISAANLNFFHYKKIESLIRTCLDRRRGELYAAFDSKNNIFAVAFFLTFFNTQTLLFNCSNKNTKISSMTFLINEYIKLNVQKNKLLDFEGSNIPGVQKFYKGFGAIERNYIHVIK